MAPKKKPIDESFDTPATAADQFAGEAAQAQEQEQKPKTAKKGKAPVSDDLIIQKTHEISNMPAAKIIEHAKELIESTGKNDFELGLTFGEIQEKKYWEGLGFDSFKTFIEDTFGLPYRKAMYLIDISNSLVNSGVEWKSVKDVGWTKLKELAGILTPENVDEWVALAATLTTNQLIEQIKQSKTKGATPSAPTTVSEAVSSVKTKTFKLHGDQNEVVEAAVEKAKADTGSEADNVAITHVCTSFLESTTGKTKITPKNFSEFTKAIPKLPTEQKVSVAETAMAAIGYEKVLELFEKLFPEIDIAVEEAAPQPE